MIRVSVNGRTKIVFPGTKTGITHPPHPQTTPTVCQMRRVPAARRSGALTLRPGSSTTTLTAAPAHSQGFHPSADSHQPDGRVHLGGLAVPRLSHAVHDQAEPEVELVGKRVGKQVGG